MQISMARISFCVSFGEIRAADGGSSSPQQAMQVRLAAPLGRRGQPGANFLGALRRVRQSFE